MVIPKNQLTGTVSEIDVERLFISWGWNVGHDRIDAGYDLSVMPDRERYQGARFLVQVKGTARRKSKNAVVAQISKSRLREYATDTLPVFITRVLPNGDIYWLHAQSWALNNSNKLNGDGTGGVRFDTAQTLGNRAGFEAYLSKILNNAKDAVFVLAAESRLLNNLDPRFGIKLSIEEHKKKHEIFAKTNGAEGKFVFTTSQSSQNLKSLEDAIGYGLPRSIEVSDFKLTGSPIFDHIGASTPNNGKLSIGQEASRPTVVRMLPGPTFSMLEPELTIPADLYRGQQGVAITNEGKDSIFNLDIRIKEHGKSFNLVFNISIRLESISKLQIQSAHDLRPAVNWFERLSAQKAMYLELDIVNTRIPITIPSVELNKVLKVFYWIQILSKLHTVARSLNSPLSIPKGFALERIDVNDIELAYALLKGDRKLIGIESLEFNSSTHIAGADHIWLCTTTLRFTIADQFLGDIPVDIELSNYTLEELPASDEKRLSKNDASQAWVSYSRNIEK